MKTASPAPEAPDALAADIGAALLGTVSRVLNGWAMVFAIAALLILGLHPFSLAANAGLAASIAAALLQTYFAARCAFDAAIFARLGGASGPPVTSVRCQTVVRRCKFQPVTRGRPGYSAVRISVFRSSAPAR